MTSVALLEHLDSRKDWTDDHCCIFQIILSKLPCCFKWPKKKKKTVNQFSFINHLTSVSLGSTGIKPSTRRLCYRTIQLKLFCHLCQHGCTSASGEGNCWRCRWCSFRLLTMVDPYYGFFIFFYTFVTTCHRFSFYIYFIYESLYSLCVPRLPWDVNYCFVYKSVQTV